MKTAVKICGLTRYEDAAEAARRGASYLGFIFAPSPRQVDAATVAAILDGLKKSGLRDAVRAVGVFVNEREEVIERIIAQTGIDLVQLHGDEEMRQANRYAFPWYKVFRIGTREDVDILIVPRGGVWRGERFLIDTRVEGRYGGSGVPVDPAVARYAREKTREAGKLFYLAGGITPENVAALLQEVAPDGIDVGSGIEERAGKKSWERMALLFERVTRYGAHGV